MSLATAAPSSSSDGTGFDFPLHGPEFSVLLRTFYDKIFPCQLYYEWLNDCQPEPTKLFQNREFSFTVGDDVYIRYQSFRDCATMKDEFLRLCPNKIDIGAVYTTRPKDKKSILPSAFQPIERDLVFDIDMTDYDEIRTCCSGGDICPKCWKFMIIAMKVIHASLVEDFGFKHILWVYSGRRGVHCWVSDASARRLTNEGRKALVGYLEVIRGGSQQERKVNLPAQLHPHLTRSFATIKEYFSDLILGDQDILTDEQQWSKVIKIIPDESIRQQLRQQWSDNAFKSSQEKWEIFDNILAQAASQKKQRGNYLANLKRDIVFQYTYPRLDDKVTTGMNHLLKSPFCVHPKTGKVCVPIHPDHFDDFDPFTVPTLACLLKEVTELDNAMDIDTTVVKTTNASKSLLRPFIKVFEEFVNGIRREQRQLKEEMSMEF